MKRLMSLIITMMILLIPLLTACQPTPEVEPLVVLIANDEGRLTPTSHTSTVGQWMTGWVYDSLYARDVDLNPVPSLATGATPSADGLSWEITLRDDITWHDGEPLTPNDVIFSYGFLMKAGYAPQLAPIDHMEMTGDHALRIVLRQPSPFFLREALASTYIVPAHIWQDVDPESEAVTQFEAGVGTGAYRLTEVVPGESYTFTANEDYFVGEPRVKIIRADIVTDPVQREEQLKAGAAAAILDPIGPTRADTWAEAEGIALSEGSDFTNYVLYVNGSRPPFDQTRVREAISMAIDTRGLVNAVMAGRGMALPSSYYHPDLPWAVGIPHIYDPDATRALLEFSGLTDSDGNGIREWNGEPTAFTMLCNSNQPTEVAITTFVVNALRNVGLDAQPNCVDNDTLLRHIWPNFVAVTAPDYDLALWSWPGDSQLLRGFIGYLVADPTTDGWANLSGTVDADLDALSTQLLTTTSAEQREMLSEQVQDQLSRVMPMIPLISPNVSYAYRPDAYDGWVYMKGTGIMTVWSFLP